MLDKAISLLHYNAKMRILSDYLSFFTHKLSTIYIWIDSQKKLYIWIWLFTYL